MHKLTLRRTLNLGNYETIAIETTAEHDDLNQARLLATKQALELSIHEMHRIFQVRLNNINSNPLDQVNMELQWVYSELNNPSFPK